MDRFSRLKKIDSQIHLASRSLDFSMLNPNNIQEQKEILQEDPEHNPIFTYDPVDVSSAIKDLKNIETDDSPMGKILEDKRKEYLNFAYMLKFRGTNKFQKFNDLIYGKPDDKLIEYATELIVPNVEIQPRTVSSASAANKIRAEIEHFGFDYVVGMHPPGGASAFVTPSRNFISIAHSETFSEKFVKRLLIHEVGTHVLRAENGKLQPFKIFHTGFPGYLETEEGLAAYNEQRFNLLTLKTLSTYGARVVACNIAQKGSFSDIYNFLRGKLGEQTAFQIAMRAKRGLKYTKKKGGSTKDHLYLKGFLEVTEFVKQGGNVKDLYVGKISLEHLSLLKGIPWLIKPKYLPNNQFFKDLLQFK